jgi:tetratricopeptide (TPR) repeat protein
VDWLYSPTALLVVGLLAADVAAGLLLLGLARAKARLGDWPGADRWYRLRLAAPLPATQVLLDRLHGQRAFLQHERLATMRLFGRFEDAARYGGRLAGTPATPAWLRLLAEAQAAESLAETGHLDSALGRLGALLDEVPEEVAPLRGSLHATSVPLLLAAGRFDEAERSVEEVERLVPGAGAGWPVHRLAMLLARDEERAALRLVRPLLEGTVPLPEPSEAEVRQSHGAAAVGPLLVARAAHEAGWAELASRLLEDLRGLAALPPLHAPLLSALEAAAAACRGESAAAEAALRRAELELARVGPPAGTRLETERLLVEAELRLGRTEAAVARAAGLVDESRTPLGRWRAGRALGEALEAAGRSQEAAEAYRAALGTGLETRMEAELERRVAELEGLGDSGLATEHDGAAGAPVEE